MRNNVMVVVFVMLVNVKLYNQEVNLDSHWAIVKPDSSFESSFAMIMIDKLINNDRTTIE